MLMQPWTPFFFKGNVLLMCRDFRDYLSFSGGTSGNVAHGSGWVVKRKTEEIKKFLMFLVVLSSVLESGQPWSSSLNCDL